MISRLQIFLALSFLSFSIFGQLTMPNGDFETWIVDTSRLPLSFERPAEWRTEDCIFVTSTLIWNCNYYGYKSTDAYSGKYALKLSNDFSAALNDSVNDSFGAVSSASGIGFTGDPDTMYFYLKSNLVGSEKVTINVYTLDSASYPTAAGNLKIETNENTYKLQSIPINKISSTSKTKKLMMVIDIEATASSPGGVVDKSSYILIDDIYFNNQVITSAKVFDSNQDITIFPNPVSGLLNFGNTFKYDVIDNQSQIILSGEGNSVNVSALKRGNYFIRLSNYKGSFNKQFLKTE